MMKLFFIFLRELAYSFNYAGVFLTGWSLCVYLGYLTKFKTEVE